MCCGRAWKREFCLTTEAQRTQRVGQMWWTDGKRRRQPETRPTFPTHPSTWMRPDMSGWSACVERRFRSPHTLPRTSSGKQRVAHRHHPPPCRPRLPSSSRPIHPQHKAALHAALHSPASGARSWMFRERTGLLGLTFSTGHTTDVPGRMQKPSVKRPHDLSSPLTPLQPHHSHHLTAQPFWDCGEHHRFWDTL